MSAIWHKPYSTDPFEPSRSLASASSSATATGYPAPAASRSDQGPPL